MYKPESVLENEMHKIIWEFVIETDHSKLKIWVEKVIHWELCKRLRLDHVDKWYMYKPESILENEMDKILCEFVVWFLLFNGIVNFVGYLMPKPPFKKNSSDAI